MNQLLSRSTKMFLGGCILVFIGMVIGWMVRGSFGVYDEKLRMCPEKWESGYGEPFLSGDYTTGPESRIYIQNKEYNALDFDQAWIARFCAVNKPTRLPE